MSATELDAGDAELIARLVPRTLVLLETEYPHALRLDLRAEWPGPVSPRALHPAFHGCYDWHSAVHSVWQVVRALRTLPDAPFADRAFDVLDRLLTDDHLAAELAWVDERPGFEMPYGMAWLLRLDAEVRVWDHEGARRWSRALDGLRRHALDRFVALCGRLTVPVRGGVHDQTAFSLGLVWDSVDRADPLRGAIADAAQRFYAHDTDADLRFEPSAADFLSPSLAEADLLRRTMAPDDFATWFERFLPDGVGALRPVEVVDPSDGRLAHWAGLNLSRSWAASSIADALPPDHALAVGLRACAAAHRAAGLAAADHDDLMISHWVPTFAVHLLTGANGSPSP